MNRTFCFGCGVLMVVLLAAAPCQGSNEFLWKPSSENSGKLVILFPQEYRQNTVQSIVVEGAGGKTSPISISQNGANGDRIHARFKAGGANFGKNIKVTLHFKTGGSRTWTVPNGAQRFTVRGGGTGDAAPAGGAGGTAGSGATGGGGFSGLDSVLGTGDGKDALIVLSHTKPGKKKATLAKNGKIKATVCLRTFGRAVLEVSVNGKPWITWARNGDADPSPCQENGKEQPKSMFEENPGDFSARDITFTYDGKAGDVISASLAGKFGGADSYVVIK